MSTVTSQVGPEAARSIGSCTRLVDRCWFTPSGAAVVELPGGVTGHEIFRRVSSLQGTLFFDSCPKVAEGVASSVSGNERHGSPSNVFAGLGRYSFVAALPVEVIEAANRREIPDALRRIRDILTALTVPTIPGLPPFQGGLAGLLGYEFGLAELGVPSPGVPDVPAIHMGFYDLVAAFDHVTGSGWILSQGIAPGDVPTAGMARRTRSLGRLETFLAAIDKGTDEPSISVEAGSPAGIEGLTASHDEQSYRQMVARAIEYVRAGDIFQVNLAQTLEIPFAGRPADLLAATRAVNPAPFAAFYDLGRGSAVVSGSPERFLQVARGVVRMHPIKGTRPILSRPEADLFAGDDLSASDKDRAENVMIVDLVRNDLSRVCRDDSVRVESLCRLERYAYVQHLVSVVAGRLAAGRTPLDAVLAAVPGGSVTGAPKHRACEIIGELEGRPRGVYCGSLGYLGLDGSADWSLLIRTFFSRGDRLVFPVGGGITAVSDPLQEYRETLDKAEGLLRAVAVAGGRGSRETVGSRPS